MQGCGDRVGDSCRTPKREILSVADEVVDIPRSNEPTAEKRTLPTLTDVVDYFKQYCNSTAIHGVRYLAEDHRSFTEKLFWLTALTACAVGCGLMISKVKEKLDTTPIIVTFAESATNVWHLPFPAVTICPLNKSRRTLFNFTKYANMIRDKVDLQEDYYLWLENMYLKMAENMYHDDNIEEFLDDNTTSWVREKFVYDVRPHLYEDVISEELTLLLEQIFGFITEDSQFFNPRNMDNSTWKKIKFAEWTKRENLRNRTNQYFPTWRHEIYQKLRTLHTVCPTDDVYFEPFYGNNTSFTLDESGPKFLKKVSSRMDISNNTILRWGGNLTHMEGLFKPIWTDLGLCYAFNMMDSKQIYSDKVIFHKMYSRGNEISKDWDPDTGYSPEAGRDTYPRRPPGLGIKAGLDIVMRELAEDIDYVCHEGALGYEIILHRPEDQPQPDLNYAVHIPFEKEAIISIKPSIMTTSPGLEKYDAQKRQCYFSHENHLEYFKFYSKNNCELECLTKVTLRECGCVALYMPRNASTKICGANSFPCTNRAAKITENQAIDEDLKEFSKNKDKAFNSAITKTHCDCLPSCVSITYEADITFIDWDKDKYFEAVQMKKIYNTEKDEGLLSGMWISLKSKHIIASRRSELYGRIDFLANCGGLVGLFCGFSIISLIEIFYFFTIRLWYNFRRHFISRRKLDEKPDTAPKICKLV